MCGRFTLIKPKAIPTRFNVKQKIPLFEPTYNAAPSQTLPVVVKKSPNKVVMMRWGFIPEWGKEKGIGLINIRSESTKEKPYFRNVLVKRRCLIPSNGFYEWKTIKLEEREEKVPFFIHLKGSKLFGFAGLYSSLTDAEGKEINSFAILTCSPNASTGKIHNRMPVILKKETERTWLDPENSDINKLHSLLVPFPASEMETYPVSKLVNSPKSDGKKLIRPFREKKLF